eukprot:510743_1
MATNFKWIITVPNRTKNCVIGYIRNKQQILPSNTTFYNIPLLITYLVLDYYYERESFKNRKKENIIKLDQKLQIARVRSISNINTNTYHSYGQHTVFGSHSINFSKPFIYEWNIQILNLPSNLSYGNAITIGIVNKHNLDEICYGYSDYGIIKDKNVHIYAESFHRNDIITLQINCKTRMLQYFVNDCEYTDCINIKTDGTYYFAVSMVNNCAVKLIQFDQIYIQNLK